MQALQACTISKTARLLIRSLFYTWKWKNKSWLIWQRWSAPKWATNWTVRNSTTFSNKSLLLHIVTWLLHVTNFSNIECIWTYIFKLQNALTKILEKKFESFFQHKNFINFNFLYTFFVSKKWNDRKKTEWWQS